MIHIVKQGETLSMIAMDYRSSIESILRANNGMDPNLLYPGQKVVIPGLPSPQTIPYTIWISLSKKTLTLYNNYNQAKVFPIAVGRMLQRTPIGDFVVVNREPNPGGPFGLMWLSLSKIHYGIHGTNNPSSIGKDVSAGCVRMYNQDVLELAEIIPNGTAVYIRS
jgi:L,D-transpeptidase ErfK/SrfK